MQECSTRNLWLIFPFRNTHKIARVSHNKTSMLEKCLLKSRKSPTVIGWQNHKQSLLNSIVNGKCESEKNVKLKWDFFFVFLSSELRLLNIPKSRLKYDGCMEYSIVLLYHSKVWNGDIQKKQYLLRWATNKIFTKK